MLMKAIDSYLSVRRAAGFELEVPEYLLRSFARYAEQHGETHVSAQTTIQWAAQAPSVGQRRNRLNTIIRFARHIRVEDQRHELPPLGLFGPKPPRRIPFIYTPFDIQRLVRTAYQLGPANSLRPYTYATLFSLLSATGIRISEALSLRLDNVGEDGLVIQQTKFKKSRLVPLHATASAGLKRYLDLRTRMATDDDHVFVSLQGRLLSYRYVNEVFTHLIKQIGLDSLGRRPRIHDIRHTFAVRVLESCCTKNRDAIDRNMLALATYLGHAHVADTYWYLEATPQLMTDIAQTCEDFFRGRNES